jgi:deazaflavin-dependent oxidoreductase (nitroreductase family)
MNWKYFGKFHEAVYRLSGGRLLARMGKLEAALVETTGRKSGKPRAIAIICYPYKDSIVISASNSGMDRHPAWYLNMQANPRVRVQRGAEHFEAMAEDVPAAEREALWQQIFAVNDHQREYQTATSREIPLVYLRPV